MINEQIEARITELEKERDEALANTEFIQLSKKSSTHSRLKQKYNGKINCLRKHGVESNLALREVQEKRMKTVRERYGAGCNIEKVKETKMNKYGHMFGNKESIRETKIEKYGNAMGDIDKLINSKLEKYGNIYGPDANDKAIKTRIDKYGNAGWNVIRCRETRMERYGHYFVNSEKAKETNIERYGYVNGNIDAITEAKLAKYGNVFGPNNFKTISKLNKWWQAFIALELDIEFEMEFAIKRKVFDLKYDNLLVEINPAVSHNHTFNFEYLTGRSKHNDRKVAKDYHVSKTKLANQYGFNLIHIWDWDDPVKVLNIIKNLVNVNIDKSYARDLQVIEISQYEANKFLAELHLQGPGNKQTVCLALVDKEYSIKQVMTFGRPRFNCNFEWELIRLCSNCQVVGGSHRLFNYFVNNYKPKSIVSYCDYSKFNGETYKKLGFSILDTFIGRHWYRMQDGKHINNSSIRMRGAEHFTGNADSNLSNEDKMIQSGFVEIYDAGQATFAWHA